MTLFKFNELLCSDSHLTAWLLECHHRRADPRYPLGNQRTKISQRLVDAATFTVDPDHEYGELVSRVNRVLFADDYTSVAIQCELGVESNIVTYDFDVYGLYTLRVDLDNINGAYQANVYFDGGYAFPQVAHERFRRALLHHLVSSA